MLRPFEERCKDYDNMKLDIPEEIRMRVKKGMKSKQYMQGWRDGLKCAQIYANKVMEIGDAHMKEINEHYDHGKESR